MAKGMMGSASPATEWVGIEIASAAGGEAVLRMPARAEMGNRAGVVHGGFIALLADSAMGRAMSSVLPDGERHYSFDLKMSFISAGRLGETLQAVGRVLHSGRRTGVADCRVTALDGSAEGRLVAAATATFIVELPSSSGSET